LDWFEVKEVRGTIQSGTVHEYQVTLDVGFRYLSDDEMRDWLKG
jgi:flavin-binding protein dodecin